MLDIPEHLMDLVIEYNRTFKGNPLGTERAPDNFPTERLEALLREALRTRVPIDQKTVFAVSNPEDNA